MLGCYSTLGWDIELDDEKNRILSGFDPYGFEIPMMLTIGNCLKKSEQDRKYLQQILKYLEQEYSNEILYLNRRGEEQPLREFFC